MEPGRYCRDVESYLCQKNDGHLIRVVGPAFELVRGWASREIPLSVVHRAIDRTFERYYAKGPRRRPVRIEFCEADVLTLFDEWRRAVGVHEAATLTPRDVARRRPSLVAHIDRIMAVLTAGRTSDGYPVVVAALVGRIVEELDALRGVAKGARGESRQRIAAQLEELDQELTTIVRDAAEDGLQRTLRVDAERDLEPFKGRMPPEAFARAVGAATDRLLREHFKLPRIAFD